MIENQSKFKIFSVRCLPAGIWGESYAIVATSDSDNHELIAEVFLLTTRPQEALHSIEISIHKRDNLPPDLVIIDLEFAMNEGLLQAEVLISEKLEERANQLSREDLAYMPFELKPSNQVALLNNWMRNRFHTQLMQISDETKCNSLAKYLKLFNQVGVIVHIK